jgi:hypothetical protein
MCVPGTCGSEAQSILFFVSFIVLRSAEASGARRRSPVGGGQGTGEEEEDRGRGRRRRRRTGHERGGGGGGCCIVIIILSQQRHGGTEEEEEEDRARGGRTKERGKEASDCEAAWGDSRGVKEARRQYTAHTCHGPAPLRGLGGGKGGSRN